MRKAGINIAIIFSILTIIFALFILALYAFVQNGDDKENNIMEITDLNIPLIYAAISFALWIVLIYGIKMYRPPLILTFVICYLVLGILLALDYWRDSYYRETIIIAVIQGGVVVFYSLVYRDIRNHTRKQLQKKQDNV